jgi:hypothetical protein
MKCICGYDENDEFRWFSHPSHIEKDLPKFKRIDGRFFVGDEKEIELFMCPKCGTIQGR